MKAHIRIRAVPVSTLLEVLKDLYSRGVDFIDFEGELDEEEDKLGVSFRKEYMNPKFVHTFENFNDVSEEPNIEVKKKFDDEDLNQLI